MIIVADTSPLSYLVRIECEEVLPKLYGVVVVPHAVMDELRHEKAPKRVREWALSPPSWLDIRSALIAGDSELELLGAGEGEAILLAQQTRARLLIDERRGAHVATSRGLQTTGTLGVLVAAAERGHTNLDKAIQRLFTETNFRISAAARGAFLEEHRISIDG